MIELIWCTMLQVGFTEVLLKQMSQSQVELETKLNRVKRNFKT